MGWYIHCLENSVVIPEEDREWVNEAMLKAGEHQCFNRPTAYTKSSWQAVDPATGKLCFYQHHKEWMDYLWREEIQRVLKKAKANGVVRWGCNSGDWAGDVWWYEFKKGRCTRYDRKKDHFKLWLK